MKSNWSFTARSFAGTLLALVVVTGATPCVSCLGHEAARWTVDSYRGSYRSVARLVGEARMWERIARLWVDPEHAISHRNQAPKAQDDVCQMRTADR